MNTKRIFAVALSMMLGTGLAFSQSGSTRVLAADGKTYLVTTPAIDGCAAAGGLRFDGIGGVIYCPGYYTPPPTPAPTVIASNSGSGGSDGGNGSTGTGTGGGHPDFGSDAPTGNPTGTGQTGSGDGLGGGY